MKLLLTTLVLLTTLSATARTVVLHQSEFNLGILEQETSMPALEEVTIQRDAQTPKKVKLNFDYSFRAKVCKDWEQRVIVIPGNVVCVPNQGCHTTPPQTQVVQECVRWEREYQTNSKQVTLNFSKAAKLNGEQQEAFLLILEQESLDKKKVTVSGEVINAQVDYTIKYSDTFFTKPSLKFIAE